jgi:hypothetical protein
LKVIASLFAAIDTNDVRCYSLLLSLPDNFALPFAKILNDEGYIASTSHSGKNVNGHHVQITGNYHRYET